MQRRLLLWLVLTLSACNTENTPAPIVSKSALHITTLATPIPPTAAEFVHQEWETHWLAKTSCVAPCWEGITPGQTTVAEALAHLRTLPFVTNIATVNDPEQETTAVRWDWHQAEGSGQLTYSTTQSPPVVARLRLVFPSLLRLSEVLAAYGPPSHVVPLAFNVPHGPGNIYRLYLLYHAQCLMLDAKRGTPDQLALRPELALYGTIVLTATDSPALEFNAGSWDASDMIEWQGFHDFDFYCQQARSTSPHRCK